MADTDEILVARLKQMAAMPSGLCADADGKLWMTAATWEAVTKSGGRIAELAHVICKPTQRMRVNDDR